MTDSHDDPNDVYLETDLEKTRYWRSENDDELHRLDGPAIERANGTVEWFFNGVKYDVSSLEEFHQQLRDKGLLT